ncbi:MAG: hypothetical protein JNJ70_09490 [Verrucomicrobiales bacterium]|nr:hypothetical protein [Verrucomicrobiales bacterium]
MTGVDQLVELDREFAMVSPAEFFRRMLQGIGRSHTVIGQPLVASSPPLIRDVTGDRVHKPGGDEIGDTPLTPMRQTKSMFSGLAIRIESDKGHGSESRSG